MVGVFELYLQLSNQLDDDDYPENHIRMDQEGKTNEKVSVLSSVLVLIITQKKESSCYCFFSAR